MKFDCSDIVISVLDKRGFKTEEIKGIDPDLLDKAVPDPDGGKYRSCTWLHKSDKFRKICLGKGATEGEPYGYAGTIFSDEKYDLPIFAYDIREIKGRILIVLDIKPVLRTPEYLNKYIEPVKILHETYNNMTATPLKSTWTAEFRSGYGIHCLTAPENEDRVKECFLKYLNLYLDYAQGAQPVSAETRDAIKKYMEYYTVVYKQKDPGAVHTIKLFGRDWAERHLDILF